MLFVCTNKNFLLQVTFKFKELLHSLQKIMDYQRNALAACKKETRNSALNQNIISMKVTKRLYVSVPSALVPFLSCQKISYSTMSIFRNLAFYMKTVRCLKTTNTCRSSKMVSHDSQISERMPDKMLIFHYEVNDF